ncbi:unnamed protein product [Symbiodinium natans]|uniref:Uncharacterized protein n=1 Tax=Symbiodinium natans TaxID=878477 RepID=A0A812UP52_9DINO|nr:unnamed protein product [Symbiodinium natans]CAE7589972.1 unnamed protein product [Symbiodinium natans]
MRSKSYKSGRFDVKYHEKKPGHRSNYMDLTHTSGFLLACYFILRGRPQSFFAIFAVKCASFSQMNRGTSKRSACSSVGMPQHASVKQANQLLERSVLLIFLVTSLRGTWFLEQPRGSCLEFYPTFRKLFMALYITRDRPAVFRVSWWMGHFASATPKRHYGYANSAKIRSLDRGKLHIKSFTESQKVRTKTTKRSINREGKECYTATASLRGTEKPGCPKY